MWLTPWRRRTSRVSSATCCETRPSAAAPKMILVLLCRVRPNRAFGITSPTYTGPGRPARAWLDRVLWVGVSSIHEEAASGIFQPQDEKESRNPGQPAEEEAQRSDHQWWQATGALRGDRRGARGRQAAPALQIREQGDLRPPGRARGTLNPAATLELRALEEWDDGRGKRRGHVDVVMGQARQDGEPVVRHPRAVPVRGARAAP